VKIKPILAAATIVSAMSLGWVFSASLAEEGMQQVGRYSQSSVFRQEGLDRVYVTVMDTATGEIVRLDRFDTGDYEEPDFIPGK
jgi:hypothetical protein